MQMKTKCDLCKIAENHIPFLRPMCAASMFEVKLKVHLLALSGSVWCHIVFIRWSLLNLFQDKTIDVHGLWL